MKKNHNKLDYTLPMLIIDTLKQCSTYLHIYIIKLQENKYFFYSYNFYQGEIHNLKMYIFNGRVVNI